MKTIALAFTAALFIAGLAGSTPSFAQSKPKAKPAMCNVETCIATCNNRGGRTRLCPTYCQDRINSDPKCK